MDDAFRVAENSDASLIADEVAADARRLAGVIRRPFGTWRPRLCTPTAWRLQSN
jgi:hypothetical protein